MSVYQEPDGAFSIRFEQRDGYLYTFVQGGADNAEVSGRYWQRISEYCKKIDCSRVLVVESFTTPGSLVDVYTVAAEIPRLMKGVRVAFVDESTGDYEENIFGETVALNRGATGRVFRDEESAINWLTS